MEIVFPIKATPISPQNQPLLHHFNRFTKAPTHLKDYQVNHALLLTLISLLLIENLYMIFLTL